MVVLDRLHFTGPRGSLEIETFHVYQPVAEHVNGSLALLQNDVADEGFKSAILWLHVYEYDLTEDLPESFDLDADRAAYCARYRSLRSGLELYRSNLLQVSKAISPSCRQDHVRCAGVNQCITSNLLVRRCGILNPD